MLFCICPLCDVHWKTKAVRLLTYFFVYTKCYLHSKFFLPRRQSHSVCTQTKHKLSAETGAINTTQDSLVTLKPDTEVLQIITTVHKMTCFCFSEGKWNCAGQINSSIHSLVKWLKLQPFILLWRQTRNLCTCWMFVCVFPSKAALFDCSESHFLAMWMLVFILFEFWWEIFRFFPSANYDWIFFKIKYRWWITDGCTLELWEAALRTDLGTHKLILSKQKRRTY